MNWRKLLGLAEKPTGAPMGSTKCSGCDAWSYDVIQKWEDDPEDQGVAISTCTGCGHTSRWVYGPGLMLNIDDEPVGETEAA